MKTLNVLVLAALLGFSVQGHAETTLATTALKCGGFLSVVQDGKYLILDVNVLKNSTCSKIEIPELDLRSSFNASFRVPLTNVAGKQLKVIINESEGAVLDLRDAAVSRASGGASAGSSVGTSTPQMSEYERRSLALQEQRAARERAQRAAENAAAAGAVAGAVGGALIEGLGGLER